MKTGVKIITAIILVTGSVHIVIAGSNTPVAPKGNAASSTAIKPSSGEKPLFQAPSTAPQSGANIHLNPAYLPRANVSIPMTLATLKKDCALIQNGYDVDASITGLANIAQSCRTRAYSPRDQRAAGCLPTDTLQQCHPKLYRYCMTESAMEGVRFRMTIGNVQGWNQAMDKCLPDLTQFKNKLNAVIQLYRFR